MINTADLDAAETSIVAHRASASAVRRAEQIATPEVLQAIKEHVASKKLTRVELAKRLLSNDTQVSKYLNDRADFSVNAMERKIRDYLRHAEARELYRQQIFETSVTRTVGGVIETMRRSDQFGLIHGAAGWGKTSGIKMYLTKNALAVGVEVYEWTRGSHAQIRLLWDEAGVGVREYGESKIEWLIKRYKGSERPIIVDNAHQLTYRGLKFWFDFRDVTKVPIIFVGNPEVVAAIRKSDQMFSRLGPHEIVGLKDDELQPVAQKLIGQALKQEVPELEDAAVDTIQREGHLRSLWNQLTTAREIKENRPDRDWLLCFKSAGTKMVRNNEECFGAKRNNLPATRAGR